MLLVVAYDIADDRRRVRVHTLLHGYGTAVQESLFECDVSEEQAHELQRRVRRLVRRSDRVRYYRLCRACAERIVDLDGQRRPGEPAAWVV